MADGLKMKVPALDKNMAKLRKIAPSLDKHVDDALGKNANEFAKTLPTTAPKRSGDLAKSFDADKTKDGWEVSALFYWLFLEYGTVNMKAQPFVFSTYRLLKKRFRGRTKRAINKAVKEALK